MTRGYQSHAYEAVKQEHGRYFDALEIHPRMLVGKEVPALNGEGMETLKDASDAREWQDAIREILVQEIDTKTQEWVQGASGFMETIHANVDMFTRNPDLIPGTKGFDKRLADEFASMMQPYEVRVRGKLQGYSIPTQPIIEKLRKMAGAGAAPVAAAKSSAAAEPPQAAIRSRAPSGDGPEDFSTLFGTIGLPQLRI